MDHYRHQEGSHADAALRRTLHTSLRIWLLKSLRNPRHALLDLIHPVSHFVDQTLHVVPAALDLCGRRPRLVVQNRIRTGVYFSDERTDPVALAP